MTLEVELLYFFIYGIVTGVPVFLLAYLISSTIKDYRRKHNERSRH